MTIYYGQELYHYGVEGQKWGVRRYQNEDGSLTQEGYLHYYGKSRGNGIVSVSRSAGGAKDYVRRRVDTVKETVKGKYGLGNTLLNATLGTTRGRDYFQTVSDVTSKAAERSKSKFIKNINEKRSYNSRELAKQYDKIANSASLGKRIANNLDILTTKQVNLYSGKESTVGKNIVDGILVNGVVGLTAGIAAVPAMYLYGSSEIDKKLKD